MDYRAQKRVIIGLIVIFLLILFSFPLVSILRKPTPSPLPPLASPLTPELAPRPVLRDLKIIFVDFFEIRKFGTYDVVAFVENPNLEYGASKILYEFTLTNLDGQEIAKVRGSSFILPRSSRYIIESAVKLSEKPGGASFRVEQVQWDRLSKAFSKADLAIRDIQVRRDNTLNATNVSGIIRNNTLFRVENIEASAVLYETDEYGKSKPAAAGRTNMQLLDSGKERFFQISWPYLLPYVNVDARVESNFFENSNFRVEYGTSDIIEQFYGREATSTRR